MAVADAADPRILDAIALVIGSRHDRPVVVDRDDLQSIGRHFHRQQPAERRQRHHLPARRAHHELARVLGIDMLQRPGVEHIAAVDPTDRMDVSIVDRFAQRLRDTNHQQQITVRQTRHAGVERAQHIGFGIEMPAQRRARQVDIVRREDQPVGGKAHSPS
ncbi:hypothetical protein ACFSC3_05875 [Sphingomonas floccifaciens]|uniref:Uncharacterized protein n=1 Tax=Sphingomonas floccifaciens TaxID=1844115 RepID=A0ABW4NAA2_9SPHN